MSNEMKYLVDWLLNAQWTDGTLKCFVPIAILPFYRGHPYREITGYACSTFSRLYKQYGTSDYIKRVQAAADSLVVKQVTGVLEDLRGSVEGMSSIWVTSAANAGENDGL